MHEAPQIKDIQDICADIVRTPEKVGIEADGADGAFSNLKYHAWRENHSLISDPAIDFHAEVCGNHTVKVTETLVETLLGKEHIQHLACFVTLLRSGGFFIRLLACIYPAITLKLWLVDDRLPLPEWKDLLDQMEQHCLYHFHRYQAAFSETTGDNAAARDKYVAAWKTFRYWWNDRMDGDSFYHNLQASGLSAQDRDVNEIHTVAIISKCNII